MWQISSQPSSSKTIVDIIFVSEFEWFCLRRSWGGCRPWGAASTWGFAWGNPLQSVSVDTAVAADCCQEASVPLSEGVSTDCLLVPTTWWLDFPKASHLRDRKMENAMFFIPSLGSPIPSLLWCPVGNTSQPCSLWVVTVQGHRYQEARILGCYLGGLATTEGCLIFFFS